MGGFVSSHINPDDYKLGLLAAARDLKANDGMNVAQNKAQNTGAYIIRLEKYFGGEKFSNETIQKQFTDKFFHLLESRLLIKPENIPDEYWHAQEQIARERNNSVRYDDYPELKVQETEIIRNNQRERLREWYDYLTDSTNNDHVYPAWFRFYVFDGICKLASIEKGESAERFPKRDKTTVKTFPELDRGALALMYDTLQNSVNPHNGKIESAAIPEHVPENVISAAKSGSFADFYIEAIRATRGEHESTGDFRGEWVKYDQNSDPNILFNDLHGKGTGWCTADGLSTAKAHLANGDFYVYYCYNKDGQPTIPEIAIRMNAGQVAEVRGTGPNQNMSEGELVDIAKEKYHALPGGEKFDKKSADMQRLTDIHRKIFDFNRKTGEYSTKDDPEELTADDLRFLYEIDGSIEGFGYRDDPRIKELLDDRDTRQDLAKLFGCRPEQISLSSEEALFGDIIYHSGDLDLSGLTSAEGLVLPQNVGGFLDLRGLTSAEGLVLPQNVGGLYLNRLLVHQKEKIAADLGIDSYKIHFS